MIRLLVFLALATPAFAAPAKTYQITGAVLALTDDAITLEKDGERWEISRTPLTKIDGLLVVGARVTIHYKMVAEGIAVKSSTPAKPSSAPSATERADKAAADAAKRAK